MVYYPLQLLQRVGVREVLLVTGQAARGRLHRPARRRPAADALRRRAAVRPRSDLQGAGRARRDRAGRRAWRATSPRGEQLVVCLGDNIFEYAQTEAIAALGRRRARVRDGGARPGELRRRRLRRRRRRRRHRREGRRRRHALRRRRRRTTRSSGSTATRRTCSRSSTRSSRRAAASSRSPTSTASSRGAGSSASQRVEGWWHDGGKHWADLADVGRLIERDRREQVSWVERVPARRGTRTSAAGSRSSAARARCRSRCGRRTSRARARA